MNERHLPIQLRTYRVMDKQPQVSKERRLPGWVLVFDTETSTDYAQRLHFGGFMLSSVRYNDDGTIQMRPVIEGIFADDELKSFNPEGFDVLNRYMSYDGPWLPPTAIGGNPLNRLADVWHWEPPTNDDVAHGEIDLGDSASPFLYAMDRTPFVQNYIRENGHTKFLSSDREYDPCMIVGFNLPFDISRLARGITEARGGWDHGAISLDFKMPYMPNVILKRMGAKGVEIHSTKVGNERYRDTCWCKHKRTVHVKDTTGQLACNRCQCENYFDPDVLSNLSLVTSPH